MRNESHTHAAAPTVFVLPEHAQRDLMQLRDQVRVLVRLSESGMTPDSAEVSIPPDALAGCFSRIERDLDGILEASYWSDRHAVTR